MTPQREDDATDGSWRRALLRQIDPMPGDVVADVGCGDGELPILLKLECPATRVIGFDAKPHALNSAEVKAFHAGACVTFVHATLTDVGVKLAERTPSQIVCSRVLGHLPALGRRLLLPALFAALPRGGSLHVADSGWRRLTDLLVRSPRVRPLALRDRVLAAMRRAGFADCVETGAFAARSGDVYLFRGVKA